MSKLTKYGTRSHDWFVEIVDKLGGEENAARLLRGELLISEPLRSWREEDSVIYFSVKSDGTTGEDWIKRLEAGGFTVEEDAKQVLRSPSFKPTNDVTNEVAVLKGTLFEDNDRTAKKIRDQATAGTFTKGRRFSPPNPELACLILDKLTGTEIEVMGLEWIIVMHALINIRADHPRLLYVRRYRRSSYLSTCHETCSDVSLYRCHGFAFVLS